MERCEYICTQIGETWQIEGPALRHVDRKTSRDIKSKCLTLSRYYLSLFLKTKWNAKDTNCYLSEGALNGILKALSVISKMPFSSNLSIDLYIFQNGQVTSKLMVHKKM